MLSRIRSRKGRIALTAVAAFTVAAVAFAYWTAGGSGSGSASVQGAQQALTAVQTTTLSPMYPGDSAQTISGNFNNPNSGPIHVSTVTASIASVTKATGAPAGTCTASDFTLTDAAMTVGAEVPAGNAKGSWSGAKIKFNNTNSNQDACKGATVNLSYAVE
jgi:hypothetical protein